MSYTKALSHRTVPGLLLWTAMVPYNFYPYLGGCRTGQHAALQKTFYSHEEYENQKQGEFHL